MDACHARLNIFDTLLIKRSNDGHGGPEPLFGSQNSSRWTAIGVFSVGPIIG